MAPFGYRLLTAYVTVTLAEINAAEIGTILFVNSMYCIGFFCLPIPLSFPLLFS
jgi:hypothetical protein